ncbi:hypothetical protein [Sphingomonas daechungensis]|uniref:hypothetical protein n=1 Tax=Sphingomonas daechungensis TaxID=1176646 RepID=UPI003783A279
MEIRRNPLQFQTQGFPHLIVAAKIEGNEDLHVERQFMPEVPVRSECRNAMNALVRGFDG